jgi:hypothetical protein
MLMPSEVFEKDRRRPILGWTDAFLLVQKEVFISMKKNDRVKNKMGNYSSNEAG